MTHNIHVVICLLFIYIFKPERWRENSKSETQILIESGILTKYDSI